MAKVMLINAQEEEESRVAIVENGQLIDYNYEICSREQSRGNIFKGVITKIEPSLQAAFVDYGAERAGFLPVGEIREQAWAGQPADRRHPKIEEILKKKQEIMVQVVKEGIGTKGAALSTRIAIPGRYLVIMPGDRAAGVSRKIEDEESRKKAREILESLGADEDMGIIIRTAGMDRTASEIQKDFLYLNKLWSQIMENYSRGRAPCMVYQESDVILRSIRDYFTPDVGEIVTDDKDAFERIMNFVTAVMEDFQNRVRFYEGDRPLFDVYRIEEQIDKLHEQRIRLDLGGEIVITQTEALVAIDVNSGKATTERDVELTAFKTNCQAAEEVARQLRLRDLGGLIVVDFIDMREGKHIREVERVMREALRHDKARIETTHISRLGLMEISRQRLKKSVYTTSFSPCTACSGSGVVRSIETLSLSVLRHIQSRVVLGDIAFVRGDMPIDVLVYLVNAKRDELVRLQSTYDVKIQLNPRQERHSLTGAGLSSNPVDWIEFHRRLRPTTKAEDATVATVEAAVKATAQDRKLLELQKHQKAEEARAKGEPEAIIQAILAGEDVEAVRRRLADEVRQREAERRRQADEERRRVEETRRRQQQEAAQAAQAQSQADAPQAAEGEPGDETEGGEEGYEAEAPAEAGREERGERQPPPRTLPTGGRSGPPRDRMLRLGRRPAHHVEPQDDGAAFGGFVLDADGNMVPVTQPQTPAPQGGGWNGGGGSGGGGGGGGFQAQGGGQGGGFEGGGRRRRRRRRGRGGSGGGFGGNHGRTEEGGGGDNPPAFDGVPFGD